MKGTIIGNFSLVEKIGEGGMGEVWIAEQKDLGTRVAIKLLQGHISRDQAHVTRFFNEARAVSRIPHAGIAKISDAGFTATGRAYLVMELLEGETLSSFIQKNRMLSLAQISEIGSQIASVLAATHKQGITHRDLKPDNIFLVVDAERASGMRVKVLDFGIAKLSGTLARQSPNTVGAMGTPSYMAPEQWGNAGTVDWRADLYSLGCVIFEMATGRPPFVGEHFPDLFAKHTTAQPPKLSSLAPGMPKQLDALVARLLAKKPEERGGAMKEVERELVQLGEGAGALSPADLGASLSGSGVAPTMAPDQLTVAPAVPPQLAAEVAATMAPEQPTVAPRDPWQNPNVLSPGGAGRTWGKDVDPKARTTTEPPPRRSKLPLALAGLVVLGGGAAALVAATRGGGEAPPKPVAAVVADAAVSGDAAAAPVVVAPGDAAGAELATCATAAARMASFVIASDRLRPAAQGAVESVFAAHCASDSWPIAAIGCVATASSAMGAMSCLHLAPAQVQKLGTDLDAESARREADWVVVDGKTVKLVDAIALDGDAVAEPSKPLVGALARVMLKTRLRIELVGDARRVGAIRAQLRQLGVPDDGVATTVAVGDPQIRVRPSRLEELRTPAPPPAPAKPVTITHSELRILDQAHFATGASDLDAAGRAFVGNVAAVLKSHPEIAISVEGHIDNTEDKGLGILRARAVAAALVAAGIDKARIKVHGWGLSKPIASNGNDEGRAANRRVEIQVE